jgi:hypothetical protein
MMKKIVITILFVIFNLLYYPMKILGAQIHGLSDPKTVFAPTRSLPLSLDLREGGFESGTKSRIASPQSQSAPQPKQRVRKAKNSSSWYVPLGMFGIAASVIAVKIIGAKTSSVQGAADPAIANQRGRYANMEYIAWTCAKTVAKTGTLFLLRYLWNIAQTNLAEEADVRESNKIQCSKENVRLAINSLEETQGQVNKLREKRTVQVRTIKDDIRKKKTISARQIGFAQAIASMDQATKATISFVKLECIAKDDVSKFNKDVLRLVRKELGTTSSTSGSPT